MKKIIDLARKYIFHFRKGGFKQIYKFHILNKFENKIFNKKKLIWNDLGYWQVDPMPTDNELQKFYSELYWLNNSYYKSQILIPRDINHYVFLEDKLLSNYPNSINFMNFGAGHGGISYLMAAKKNKIINIEPSDIPKFNYKNFSNYQSIDKFINQQSLNSIDIIYSSHTIEHLRDPISFLEKISKLLKKDGSVFIEVPNCRKSVIDKNYEEGGCDGRIIGSHLIYFTKDFFEKLNCKIFFYKEQSSNQEFLQVKDENDADCLRVIFNASDLNNWLQNRD